MLCEEMIIQGYLALLLILLDFFQFIALVPTLQSVGTITTCNPQSIPVLHNTDQILFLTRPSSFLGLAVFPGTIFRSQAPTKIRSPYCLPRYSADIFVVNHSMMPQIARAAYYSHSMIVSRVQPHSSCESANSIVIIHRQLRDMSLNSKFLSCKPSSFSGHAFPTINISNVFSVGISQRHFSSKILLLRKGGELSHVTCSKRNH